ncbi:tetratricopeptide repeat-containing glycosyltransferase [Bremerella sp. P1]|uniref:tetratricopeptide repeat-containing glycosyltransferase n=1 Tax=Bremerella sp. P1 TaxID=3026424 RepID=UPI002367A631|nr:glycosyltransferase [Bremerella sp. P1]WDI40809.1 glycosyltransferase [Bremerella sp. P1]
MTKEARNRKLTTVLVVNEETDLIRETLNSVRQIVDEIVLLNIGKTDAISSIASEYQARVVAHSWQESFGEARNAALAHVTGEWILWLDPGETIDTEDAAKLRQFVNSQVDIMTAYVLLVRAPQAPGTIGSEQIGQVRLHPNHPGIRYEGRVRENVIQSLAECGMSIEAVPFLVQRNVIESDSAWKIKRASRDAKLVEREIKETGPSARLMICMGEAVQTLNDQANALMFYEQACRLSEHGSAEMLEAFYGILTALDGRPDGLDTQIQTCMTALEIFPLDAQLLCAVGGYLQSKGHLDLARRSFETAYKHGQINLETWHIDDIDEIAASCLAITTHAVGREEDAERILLEALSDCPRSVRLRRQVIETHVKHGRRQEALAELDKLPADYPKIESLRSAVRGAALASQKNWVAARPYLEAAYRQGSREPLCLRWYATTLAALSELETSRDVLKVWKEREPHNAEPEELLRALVAGPTVRQTASSKAG